MRFDRLLDGTSALITGSGSGQGRAAAVLFAEHGARVTVVDVNGDGARETVEMVTAKGGEAFSLEADISQRPAAESMVEAALERFGRLDVLYNNAAVQMSGRLVDCTEEQWDLTLRTNLTCIFWACRAALPHLAKGGRGSIISTASTLGLMGSPGYAAYGAAKAGLVALTRQIAVEYAPEVRANVIAPGSIDTPRFRKVADRLEDTEAHLDRLVKMIPLHRLGLAEDIASVALFLASEQSAYVTGVTVPVDGGTGFAR